MSALQDILSAEAFIKIVTATVDLVDIFVWPLAAIFHLVLC